LEANVESLETDNARLREAHAKEAVPGRADVPVDRRQLLKLAGKTAVVGTGLAAGSALLGAQPAAANHLPGFGHFNDQDLDTTVLVGDSNGPGLTVSNSVGEAISGTGRVGVSGYSSGHRGVQGGSDTGTGVYAYGLRSNAITAQIFDRYPNGFNAVYATTAGTGNAVFGEVTNTSSPGNAVLGINRGPGNCVFGFKPGGVRGDAVVGYSQTASSRGVLGVSTNGRGGAFSGKAAQVQLLASTATTHPTSGARGDLFVDNSGRLWFCKGSTTWKQLA
jgi:hypothetical protein